MSKGYAELRARLHEILSTQAGIYRPVTPLPRQEDRDKPDDLETAEGVGATYVLHDSGSFGTDVISGPVIMRHRRWKLRLSVFAGYDLEAAGVALAELETRCHDALEDPNNRQYARCGLITCQDFTTGEQVLVKERLTTTIDFVTVYDHDVSAMDAA